MPSSHVQVVLARRPGKAAQGAFGHVDVSAAGRADLEKIVQDIAGSLRGRKQIPFHPDDEADAGEVLTAKLKGFDSWFQAQAPWSLERTVTEIRRKGLPPTLGQKDVRGGGWSFYAVRTAVGKADVVVVRAKNPSYGLSGPGKLVTAFIGNELRPVDDPLIAFDHSADLVVVDQKVFVLRPRSAERLLVDADAVKARAPQTSASFDAKVAATLTGPTVSAVQRICSKNANVGRRVERLVRDGALNNVTAAKVRAALPDAGLSKTDFGASGPLRATTEGFATVLIDIAADLYYQPRFDSSPRRVASYRKL
jgi:hypothetical protein